MQTFPLPALVVLSALTAFAQTPPVYSITDLGYLPGGHTSYANAINKLGQVAGWSDPTGSTTAFLWTSGTLQSLALFDPTAVNSKGQVVGSTPFGAPVLWSGGTLYTLGSSGLATGINEAGEISGFLYNSSISVPVVWHGGKAKVLPSPAGVFSGAYGINCCGLVVGYTGSTGTMWQSDVATTLAPLAGQVASAANGVNDRGVIVGTSSTTLDINSPAQAVFWVNGTPRSLGAVAGWAQSYGYAINNRNQAVGQLGLNQGRGTTRAFLFSSGKMYDLDTLIPANSGWEIWIAFSINDSGQIAASGIHNGMLAAAVLTPQ